MIRNKYVPVINLFRYFFFEDNPITYAFHESNNDIYSEFFCPIGYGSGSTAEPPFFYTDAQGCGSGSAFIFPPESESRREILKQYSNW